MTTLPASLPGIALVLAPAAAALAISAAARVGLRRRPALWPGCAAAALCAGWAVLAAAPRSWIVPRLVVEHLPAAALATALGAAAVTRLRGRPATAAAFAAALAAACWLASAPAARPEFWRVTFGILALAWVLRRMGNARTGPGTAGTWRTEATLALTLAVGLVAAEAPPGVVGVALVLLATAFGRAGPIPAAAVAVAVAAPLLAAGHAVEGNFGMVELVCLAALLAAAARGWAGRTLQARIGRHLAEVAAPVLLAVAGTAAAWIGARAMRG